MNEARHAFADELTNRLLPALRQAIIEELSAGKEYPPSTFDKPPAEGFVIPQTPIRLEPALVEKAIPAIGDLRDVDEGMSPTLDQNSSCKSALFMEPSDEVIPIERGEASEDAKASNWSRAESVNSVVNMESRGGEAFKINFKDADHVGQVTGDAIRSAEAMDVLHKFTQLDHEKTGMVSIEKIIDTHGDDNLENTARLSLLHNMKSSIQRVNTALGDIHRGDSNQLSLETFKVVMLAEHNDLVRHVGADHAKHALSIREMCISEKLEAKVAKLCHVTSGELQSSLIRDRIPLSKSKRQRMSRIFQLQFEPFLAFMIILNAVLLGLSLDIEPDWTGWTVLEFFFTFFFTVELGIRIYLDGCYEYFRGEGNLSNWFDALIVAFALADAGFTIADLVADSKQYNLSTFTVFRMTRIVRITRLLRLLRFKMLKELTLMLRGALGGIRTLFWAMIFLLVIVYSLGVILRQVMDPSHSSFACTEAVQAGMRSAEGFFTDKSKCNRGAWTIDVYGRLMFENVGRAMLTIFLCLTESCTAADGTPMLWHWWDTNGPWMIVGYVFVYVFVTFGIFNVWDPIETDLVS